MTNSPTLLVIVGPTAIGKTSLSLRLADVYGAEIISADSRQFFIEMAIGTAKPTHEERSQAKHHFVDFLSIHDAYNAGDFEREALEKIDDLFLHNRLAILVGGSGMYVKAVCEGLDNLPSSSQLREKLNQDLQSLGITVMQQKLQELDPILYQQMDIQNPQRLVRALEVCLLANKPFSSLRNNKAKKRPFNIIKIGLTADREILYERINDRVDRMVEDGLFEEAKALFPYRNNNALITVGYREIFEYLDGKISKIEAIELIKRNTRRFAKRQMTWFNKDKEIHWFNYMHQEKILDFVEQQLRKE